MPNMKKHVRFHLGYRATCRECSGTFTNVGSLRKHTRIAHPEVYTARLVERLKKFGVLRGPDKNALKKRIVDKVIGKKSTGVKDKDSVKVKSSELNQGQNIIDEAGDKQDTSELNGDNDLNFAADEIDDGGSRFKFSCTVCKKRFSSYLNMCRHRRKAHGNETKPRSEQCLTFGRQAKAPSPIHENPEEIAAFYANVSHNIATNLNCYIDGKPESLENFKEHIKIEGYSGDFVYAEKKVTAADFNWEYYNFPSDFCPGASISICDKVEIDDNDEREKVLFIDEDSRSSSVDSISESDITSAKQSESESKSVNHSKEAVDEDIAADIKVAKSRDSDTKEEINDLNSIELNSENCAGQGNCEADVIECDKIGEPKVDIRERSEQVKKCEDNKQVCEKSELEETLTTSEPSTMGIASGIKTLTSWMQGRKIPDNCPTGKENGAKFYQVRIADGIILNTESPAARTFHQV